MSFETEGIWTDYDISSEQREFVSGIEIQMKDYVERGRLPESVAQKILQKLEAQKIHFKSIAEAREVAKYFFEMHIMPIIYSLDEIFDEEINTAVIQGEALLEKDVLVKLLGKDSLLLKKIDLLLERLDESAKILQEKKKEIID